MKKEMESLFVIFYEACHSYFADVRMGRDESYSKGRMDALQKVINIAGMMQWMKMISHMVHEH